VRPARGVKSYRQARLAASEAAARALPFPQSDWMWLEPDFPVRALLRQAASAAFVEAEAAIGAHILAMMSDGEVIFEIIRDRIEALRAEHASADAGR
jgi:hypothetical protein